MDAGALLGMSSLHELVRSQATTFGDRVAFEVDGTAVTFAELETWSDEIAGGLAALGVDRGDRVAVLSYNRVEMLVLWIAASKVGALWCPLNHALQDRDLRYVLEDLEPVVLLCDPETASKVERLGPHLPWRRGFVVGDGGHGRLAPFDDLRSKPLANPVSLSHADPLMIVYTGGTTGLPKGVVQPHGCFLAAGARYGELFGAGPTDVHFTMNQLFHQSTHHMAVTAALCWGATAVIDRWFSVSSFWPRVVECGATIIDPIATMMTLLVQHPETDAERRHRVRISWNASSTVPPAVPETFSTRFGIPLVATYGLTEGGGGHLARCSAADRERTRSNGKGGDWYEFRIADDDGAAVAAGALGEILVRPTRPNTMMTGYWRDAERTLETVRDLWLHTGDVGFVDEEGFLHLTGRMSHWIRRRGENVSAYEVENVLSGHPSVREVCVVAVPSDLGDDEVKAFVVPSDVDRFDAAALAAWCGEQVAAFKVPRFIEAVTDLPRTSSKGEIDRQSLRGRSNERAWDRVGA